MSRVLAGFAVILGLGASGMAQASGVFSGRGGILIGPYTYEETFESPPGNVVSAFDENDFTAGVLGGLTLGIERFFVDGGFEFSKYAEGGDLDGDGEEDDTFRTDLLVTGGVYIGDRWSAFVGYRNAAFGDGFLNDDGFAETGPFFGGGVSFRAGNRIALGASLAYNVLTLEVGGQQIDDIDLDGISAKLQMNILKTPHSVFLRWQRFEGDAEEAGNYKYEYIENYLHLGYQATFDFNSW